MRAMVPLLLSLIAAAPVEADAAKEIVGERQADSTTYRVDGFDSIGLATAATVEVTVGSGWSVRAFGPADALAALRVEREGNSLRLRPRDGWRQSDRSRDRQVRVLVTMPRLTSASLSGSGQMTVDRASGPELRGAVSGSGSLVFGTVSVEELSVAIAGSGSITAAGSAAQLRVRNSGSGAFRAPTLRASQATVAVAGSGSVRAAVQGPATVSLAGSGVVDLGQSARCTVKRAGSGRVTCGG